mgnify:CR=1 FL=1
MNNIKVAHIISGTNKHNSGDVILELASKKYFQEEILKTENISFTDYFSRDSNLYNENNINTLNNFDYILVGAGGLILPDTYANKISSWQWLIDKNNYKLINKPIYVISIGYNLFYNQNMNMYDRESNIEDKERTSIFIENINNLLEKSKYFSLRHKNDVNNLNNLLENKFIDKIKYEPCPSIWYVKKYWKPKISINNKKYIAIEIKDDREWRRYFNIKKENFYLELKKFVIYCLNHNIEVCTLSHDKSINFHNYLKNNNINIVHLSNCNKNEEEIFENYNQIHTILCTAGHSQMISHSLGIDIISLVSHPKLKNFCEEIQDDNFIDINNNHNIFENIVKNLNIIKFRKYIKNNFTETNLNPHLLSISTNLDLLNIKSFGRDNKEDMGFELILNFLINEYKNLFNKNKIKLLDIGGGRGYGEIFSNNPSIDYFVLDLNEKKNEKNMTFIKGDITDQNLDIEEKFDIIFTKDTYEHILNPWDSTNNIINNLVDNGLFFFLAPFSWRYHSSPYDTYRYTHTGAQYLFERNNKMKKIFSGYQKRKNRNGFWKNKKDFCFDNNKIFTECIETFYIGQKNNDYIFNNNILDSDLTMNHD